MFGRNRHKDIRSVDQMRLLGRISRAYMPATPQLEAGESVLFDFPARRHIPGFKWWRSVAPWGGNSRGRLTVTDRRLIFSVYSRDPAAFWLAKVPSDLKGVEFALADVTHIGQFPWWNPFAWMPWFATADIVLSSRERYFFSELGLRPWQLAMESLAAMYPQLVEGEHA